MNALDVGTIISCLMLGYWLVSKLMGGNSEAKKESPTEEERPSGRHGPETPPASRTEPTWYETLDVSPSAQQEEVKAAYRENIRLYHPDKVAQLGPELRDLAERKAKEINRAFEHATKLNGWR